MFHFTRGGNILCVIFIKNLNSRFFLKKIELLTLLLSVVCYLFVRFGGANGDA